MKLYGLKFIRNTFSLTMKELAEKVGVSSNTINLWEKCTLDVTDERVLQLRNIFGLRAVVLGYDFDKEDENTSRMILAVETARLEYKIKEYNSKYIENFKIDNTDKLELLEGNREMFESLNLGIKHMAEKLPEDKFNELGKIFEEIIKFTVDDVWSKGNIMYLKKWYEIINFNTYGKYSYEDIEKCSLEEYIKIEIAESFQKLLYIETCKMEKLTAEEKKANRKLTVN